MRTERRYTSIDECEKKRWVNAHISRARINYFTNNHNNRWGQPDFVQNECLIVCSKKADSHMFIISWYNLGTSAKDVGDASI